VNEYDQEFQIGIVTRIIAIQTNETNGCHHMRINVERYMVRWIQDLERCFYPHYMSIWTCIFRISGEMFVITY
jgi:hypothetical protein